jgi:hypothetical protein
MPEFASTAVAQAFNALPESHRKPALELRELILEVAGQLNLPGGVEETLKWGQPGYLPAKPRTGSTIRVGFHDENTIALYFNCQSQLVENFRTLFGETMSYAKNRAILFDVSSSLPANVIRQCARMALRYHLDKYSN